MATFNFRHGIARHQQDAANNPTFLESTNAGSYITIKVSPDPTIFIIAHYNADYMIVENQTVPQAWGPFTSGSSYWLYWDIDFITGELTRGYTTISPIDDLLEPVAPAINQHWFDMTNMVMKVWTGSTWVDHLRVFAAEYNNANTIVSQPIGSQVGVSGQSIYAGAILFDNYGSPLQRFSRNRKGEFITTETPLAAQFSRLANFRLEAAMLQAKASEDIPAFSVVSYNGLNEIGLNQPSNISSSAIGIASEDMFQGEVRTFISSGYVQDIINWNWTEPPGTPVFASNNGEITTTPPVIHSLQRIGIIVDAITLYVDIQQLTIIGPSSDPVPLVIDRNSGNLHATAATENPDVTGFTHEQNTDNVTWNIVHNNHTTNFSVTIFDDVGNVIIPDQITIIDSDSIVVQFIGAQQGKAQLVLWA